MNSTNIIHAFELNLNKMMNTQTESNSRSKFETSFAIETLKKKKLFCVNCFQWFFFSKTGITFKILCG